jgi:hypothetical protein
MLRVGEVYKYLKIVRERQELNATLAKLMVLKMKNGKFNQSKKVML